jgi:uncharacterized membrane protein
MSTVAAAPGASANEPQGFISPHAKDSDFAIRTLWFLVAIAISALEALIPRIPLFPWLKPGFSNAITILWIIEYGTADALLFSFLRVWITGFYLGFSLFSLGLGLCGAAFATLGMGILWEHLGSRRWLGTIGIGICGACLHNAGQLTALALLLGNGGKLLVQVPVMLGASLVFGGATGWLVVPLGRFLESRKTRHVLSGCPQFMSERIPKRSWSVSALVLAASLGLLAVKQVLMLSVCAVIATILALVLTGSPWNFLRRSILRFWMLFVFIAFTNCIQPIGTFYPGMPFISREAILDTVCQWLRLWSWLACGALLTRSQFDKVLFCVLSTIFRDHEATLRAAAVALVHFGEIFSAAVKASKATVMSGWLRPRLAGRRWLVITLNEIENQIDISDQQDYRNIYHDCAAE